MSLGERTHQGIPSALKADGVLLALDYGWARIGLAVAGEDGGNARPVGTLVRKNRNEDMRRLRELVREYGVKEIVVGLPLRLDGTRGEIAEEVERFAERVRKQLGLPVELVDERLTSWEAREMLSEQGKKFSHRGTENTERPKRKKRRGSTVDAMAAAVILREYLERKRTAKEKG